MKCEACKKDLPEESDLITIYVKDHSGEHEETKLYEGLFCRGCVQHYKYAGLIRNFML